MIDKDNKIDYDMTGVIFDIKRFAVHDGPGIRTTVFLKGCPLHCSWCHNPEGLHIKKQLGYVSHLCSNCGNCVKACWNFAHTMTADNIHYFDRSKCTLCGACINVCYNKALAIYGRTCSVKEVVDEVLDDTIFYDTSGGGVTLSGGECLEQSDFCAEVLKILKLENVHTAVDTSGYVPKQSLNKVIEYTDLFLYDIKAFDEDVHIKLTGKSNKIILENLEYLDALGKNVEIRIPLVPGYNDGQIEKIASYLSKLKNVRKVRVLPYHNYSGSKYVSLGIDANLPKNVPNKNEIKEAESIMLNYGLIIVK